MGWGWGLVFLLGIAALDERKRVLVWLAEMGLHLRGVGQFVANGWRGFFGDVLMAGGWASSLVGLWFGGRVGWSEIFG